ncbi:MAG: amidase family protein, partial [Planctomycetota bacterium]
MTISLDSAATLSRQLAAGEISATDLANSVNAAVAATQDSVAAYVHHDAEAVLQAAAASDSRRASGNTLGPLDGIPVAIKDLIATTDSPTTCASAMLRDFQPPYDATVAAKLKQAGAVFTGKVNMDEFAMGASTETSVYGNTHNPWDLERTAGGSSGGSAAAVAAQTSPLALGSDTGGSIRQPSAFCGITGLKPTYGRVSRFGLVAFASSLDQIGPMAWDVCDVAMLLQCIAGHDPRDSTSLDVATDDYVAATQDPDVRDLTIGYEPAAWEAAGVAESVRVAAANALQTFRDAGAKMVEIHLPHRQYWVPTYYVIAPSEASSNLSRFDGAHYGHRATPS